MWLKACASCSEFHPPPSPRTLSRAAGSLGSCKAGVRCLTLPCALCNFRGVPVIVVAPRKALGGARAALRSRRRRIPPPKKKMSHFSLTQQIKRDQSRDIAQSIPSTPKPLSSELQPCSRVLPCPSQMSTCGAPRWGRVSRRYIYTSTTLPSLCMTPLHLKRRSSGAESRFVSALLVHPCRDHATPAP